MNAYSYVRWSSKKQTDGDSFLRQTELARTICRDRGWNLIDLPPERGVSAYHGKNLNHSSILGGFIKKVDMGFIQTPCVLIVEKLDRFSRNDVDDVLPIFLSLLKKGVQVYSFLENDFYTTEKVKSDPITTILKMLMAFVGANQYSKTLGSRVASAKKRKRESALSGKQVWMYDCCPHYFDWDKENERYVLNDNSKTVKYVFDEYEKLKSIYQTTQQLNLKGYKTFARAKFWAPAYVKNLLTARQTMGEFKGVKGYFPRIISDVQFNRVQFLLIKNAPKQGKRPLLTNFLRGKLFCSHCGKSVVTTSNKIFTRYFYCKGKHQGSCDQVTHFRAKLFEETLLSMVLESTTDDLISDMDKSLVESVRHLQAEHFTLHMEVEKLLSLQDIGMDVLRTKLTKAQKRMKEIDDELLIKQSSIHSPNQLKHGLNILQTVLKGDDDGALTDCLSDMETKLKNDDVRKQLLEPINFLIKRIVCDFNSNEYWVELTNGKTSNKIYVGD